MNKSLLLDILSIRRQHDSQGEKHFIDTYLNGCQPIINDTGEVIAYSFTQGDSKVLWSCHIDTMHSNRADIINQNVYVDSLTNQAFINEVEGDCLGADDGGGIFIMLSMIESGVGGTYLFNRGEECGCWGSSQLAELHSDWLKTFTHAIAFDRGGNTSVITKQRGVTCASDEWGSWFANRLGMDFMLDPYGVYTDTAEFTHLIAECSNISIGYSGQHTSREVLNLNHIYALCETMCRFNDMDLASMPCVRVPVKKPVYSWGGYDSQYDRASYSYEYDDLMMMTHTQLIKWVKSNDPETIADKIDAMLGDLSMAYDDYDAYRVNDSHYDDDTLDPVGDSFSDSHYHLDVDYSG